MMPTDSYCGRPNMTLDRSVRRRKAKQNAIAQTQAVQIEFQDRPVLEPRENYLADSITGNYAENLAGVKVALEQ
jgi:hypothetical protein